jgi:hypothetical protein
MVSQADSTSSQSQEVDRCDYSVSHIHNEQQQLTAGRRLSAHEGKAGFFVEYENMDKRQ